jgi:hypothetical protein
MDEISSVICVNVIVGSCVYVSQLFHLNYNETQFKYNHKILSDPTHHSHVTHNLQEDLHRVMDTIRNVCII